MRWAKDVLDWHLAQEIDDLLVRRPAVKALLRGEEGLQQAARHAPRVRRRAARMLARQRLQRCHRCCDCAALLGWRFLQQQKTTRD